MPGRNLKLLCLDGGGVRGLSSLYILQKLMETINPEAPPKPCEYFDVIGGTSTGGLIAIMLGRLEMDVASCIQWYIHLSKIIFANKERLPFTWSGKVNARFKSEPLQEAVKDIIAQQGFEREELLKKPESHCKVFVCATSHNLSTPVLFRSYHNNRDSSSLYNEAKIWEAARATSAAPTFFEPIKIGSAGRKFGDGGTGSNNPIVEMWKEAIDLCNGEPQALADNLSCLVSIGTGVPNLRKFGDSIKEVAASVIRICTETEETANDFNHSHPELSTKYWRFNAPRGLGEIQLDEAEEVGTIEDLTTHYLKEQDTYARIQACSKSIAANENRFIEHDKTEMMIPLSLAISRVENRAEWRAIKSRYNMSSERILEHLSDYDPRASYNRRAKARVKNTTLWICERTEFQSWLDPSGPRCFWLSGRVGGGKSIVMTTVIDRSYTTLGGRGKPVLHFMYDHSMRRLLTATALFESYIKQLLGHLESHGRSASPAVITWLLEFYGPKRRRPDIHELVNDILTPLVKLIGGATFIVDGIDECPKNEISDALWALRQVLALPACKVFICSREDLAASEQIQDALSLVISLEDTKDDIIIFTDEAMGHQSGSRRLTESNKVWTDVRNKLVEMADGMFLWVKLQVQGLRDECATDDEIYKALDNLPKGLDATYQRCLDKVTQSKKKWQFTEKALYFISIAVEPLKITEMQEVLVIDHHTGQFQSSPVHRHDVLDCLGSLAVLESDDELLVLTHHSVRQFLFNRAEPAVMRDSSRKLGEVCLSHLYSCRPMTALANPTTQEALHRNASRIPQHIISTALPQNRLMNLVSLRRRPSRSPVRITVPIIPVERKDQAFLEFANRNWLLQTRYTEDYDLFRDLSWDKAIGMHFSTLALSGGDGWWIYPWPRPQPSASNFAHFAQLFGWAIANRHHILLRFCLDHSKTFPDNISSQLYLLPIFDQAGKLGQLPLHSAVKSGDIDTVRILLESRFGESYLSQVDQMKRNCIHLAAANGRVDIATEILDLQSGLRSNNKKPPALRFIHKDKLGRLPSHYAAAEGNQAFLYLLYSHDEWALNGMDLPELEMLLVSQFFAVSDVQGWSAYDYAILRGSGLSDAQRTLESILEDANSKAYPKNSNSRRFDMLVELHKLSNNPAVLFASARLGMTIWFMNPRLWESQIENFKLFPNESLPSRIHVDFPFNSETWAPALALADGPWQWSKTRFTTRTLLFLAVWAGDIVALQRLVSAGVKLEQYFVYPNEPKLSITALHAAAMHGKSDAVELLLDSGAKPRALVQFHLAFTKENVITGPVGHIVDRVHVFEGFHLAALSGDLRTINEFANRLKPELSTPAGSAHLTLRLKVWLDWGALILYPANGTERIVGIEQETGYKSIVSRSRYHLKVAGGRAGRYEPASFLVTFEGLPITGPTRVFGLDGPYNSSASDSFELSDPVGQAHGFTLSRMDRNFDGLYSARPFLIERQNQFPVS